MLDKLKAFLARIEAHLESIYAKLKALIATNQKKIIAVGIALALVYKYPADASSIITYIVSLI